MPATTRLSAAADTLSAVGRCDRTEAEVSHFHSNYSARFTVFFEIPSLRAIRASATEAKSQMMHGFRSVSCRLQFAYGSARWPRL
jgi:hypothetical protein